MELVLKSKFTCPTFVPHTNPHGIAKPSIESHPQIYPLIHTLSNDSFNSKNSEVDSVEENEEKFEERFYQDFPSLEMDPTLKICSQPVVFQLSHSPSSLTFHYVYVEKKKRQLLWETSPLDPPIYLSFSHRILHALFCTLHEPCLFVAFSSMAKCYSVKTKESTWLHLPFVPWIIKPLTKGLLIQPAKPLSLSSDTSFYQQLFFIEHPLDQILPVPVNLAAVTCSDFSSFSPSTTKHNSTPPLQPSLMQLNPNEHLVFTHRHLVVLASPTQLSLYKLMPNPHATLTSHAHPSTSPLWTSSLSSSPVERKTHLPNRSFSPFDTSPLGRTPSPWPTTSLNAPPSIKEPSSSVHPSAFSSTTTTSTSSSSPSMRFAKKKLQPITTLLIPPSYQFHSMYACSDIRSNSLQYAILYSDASMGFHLHILSYAPQTCQVTHVLTFTEKVIQVVSVSWQDHPCLLIHRLDHSLHLWIGFLPSLPITVSETLSSLAWTHPATSLVVVATKANPDHLIHANLELPRWKPKPLIQMMHVLAYGLPEKEYWALVFHPPSPSSSSLADLLLQTHFPHSVLAVLSILYQEWKLNILLKSHLTQLAHVLTCLSAQLGWANYTDYFTLQFPERTRTFPLRLDASLDHPVAHVDPSHWLKLLHSKLTSQASVVHPTLSEIQDNFRIENNFTKHLNEHQLLPRTSTVCRFLDLFDATNPSPSSPEYLTIVKFLYDRYPVKSSFDSWPWYWQAIFLGFLDQAKENISAAPLRSDLALYIDRPELMPSSELSKLSLPIRERSPRLQGTTLHSLTHLTSLTQPFTHPFPQVDTPLMDAISLLELPSTPVYLDYLVVKGDALDTMTPETLKQEKRKAVEWYASKILASHFGRAAFHYHTQPFPSLSTHWTLPTLPSLSVVFPSTGHPQDSSAPVSFDPPLHATDWPEFHFGVATALSYQPGPFDEAWLWLHRPKQLTATFGGLLMGLGFIGQFKTLTPLLSLYLMRRSHVFVDMGYLLGLSIANRGSMDEILLRLVTLHTTDMDYPDPQDHPLRLMTNMLCIGLLSQGQTNPTFASIFLHQLQTCHNEAFAWCAAMGLAFMEAGLASTSLLAPFAQLFHAQTAPLVPSYLALGMVFFHSRREEVMTLILPPMTPKAMKGLPPEVLFSRCVAYHLVAWSDIRDDLEWVTQWHVPGLPLFLELPWTTAICYALALKYAGSANESALATLFHYASWLVPFTLEPALTYHEKIFKKSAKDSLELMYMCCALVMAGTGDPRVFSRLYPMQQRLSPNVTYSSHALVHMALGFLFCGHQKYSFKTKTPEQVLGLICATWPKYPTQRHDPTGPFQPLRHFWILAVQPKFYSCETLSGDPMQLMARASFHSTPERTLRLPCLVPEADQLVTISIQDPSVYPIEWSVPSLLTTVCLVQPRSVSPFFRSLMCLFSHRPVSLTISFLENIRALAWMSARLAWFKLKLGPSFAFLLDHLDVTLSNLASVSSTLSSVPRCLSVWSSLTPHQRVQYACFWFWFEVSLVHQFRVQLHTSELQKELELTQEEVQLVERLMLFGMPEAIES